MYDQLKSTATNLIERYLQKFQDKRFYWNMWNCPWNLEVRHPRCVGSITKNFVCYTYSQTQLYFTY